MNALKLSEDIRPVTDLKSHGADIVRHAESGRAVVLSRHGRAVAVVLSVAEYEHLAESAGRAELQRAVDQGNRELEAGLGSTHTEVRGRFLARARGTK
jgi:prevent-host-death family protein